MLAVLLAAAAVGDRMESIEDLRAICRSFVIAGAVWLLLGVAGIETIVAGRWERQGSRASRIQQHYSL